MHPWSTLPPFVCQGRVSKTINYMDCLAEKFSIPYLGPGFTFFSPIFGTNTQMEGLSVPVYWVVLDSSM